VLKTAVVPQHLSSPRRAQLLVLWLLAGVCVASWVYSFRMAAALGAASPHQHHVGLWPLALMWGAMMVAMMVPPEVPRLLWMVKAERPDPLLHALTFLVGYLGPWMLASLGAAALQARLGAQGLLTQQMATGSRTLGGALLVAAGAMQLSPLKGACLKRCRLRAAVVGPPGEGLLASLLRGVLSGAISIGSCGLLMLVLFVTGVMSPLAMALLTTLLLLENVAPERWPVRFLAGALLLGWGACLFLV
jgi:predicted metal-binding membrane protein